MTSGIGFTTENGNYAERFVFESLPATVSELQAMPEATLDSAFKTTALTLAVLCHFEKDREETFEMLNFLKGPSPLSGFEKQFITEHLGKALYLARSYFEGATPDNDYTPNVPFKITVTSNPYSDDNEGYMKLFVKSGGADSPRAIQLRMKGDGKWMLWEQFILPDIRVPKSADPWA